MSHGGGPSGSIVAMGAEHPYRGVLLESSPWQWLLSKIPFSPFIMSWGAAPLLFMSPITCSWWTRLAAFAASSSTARVCSNPWDNGQQFLTQILEVVDSGVLSQLFPTRPSGNGWWSPSSAPHPPSPRQWILESSLSSSHPSLRQERGAFPAQLLRASSEPMDGAV